MKTEFNLSDKIINAQNFISGNYVQRLLIPDVKEFIRLLKEGLKDCGLSRIEMLDLLDKLAGDKLK